MAIPQEIDQVLKAAMRERDQPTLDVVRMLKSRVQERTTAKGFAGEVDDALWIEVIGAYSKQMKKAVVEYGKLGERGEEQLSKIGFEVEFCARFLPQQISEDELRVLVQARIEEMGMTDPKQAGRLIGAVMKTHKGQVEAGDIKRIADEILAG
ncbi:MAG: GatB/YqeY domain-containing protein [Deltaproteobacteria bacterium]